MYLENPDYSKFVPVLFDTLSHFYELERNEVVKNIYLAVDCTKGNYEQERHVCMVFQKATKCKNLQEFYYDYLQKSSVFGYLFSVSHMENRTIIDVKQHYLKTLDHMMNHDMKIKEKFAENFNRKDGDKTNVEAEGGYESPSRKHVARNVNQNEDEGDKNGRSANTFAALEEDEEDNDEETCVGYRDTLFDVFPICDILP